MTEYYKSEITGKIIHAATEVHKELGPHFMEVVYQRALAIELKSCFEEFQREVDLPIYYKGDKIDTRRADFVIEDIMVEIKEKSCFEERDFEQILCYLKASNLKLGLLINFGEGKINVRRFVNG